MSKKSDYEKFAEVAIERLEKENARLRCSLIAISNLCQHTGLSFEDRSFSATRIAIEALRKKDT